MYALYRERLRERKKRQLIVKTFYSFIVSTGWCGMLTDVVSNPPHMMPEEGAQKVVRRLAVRQAWVRFLARHPYYGDPSSEQQQ